MAVPQKAYCPHCGQRAPIRLEGVTASCVACGGKRKPFATTTVNFAGTPWKVGGVAAQVMGGFALVFGLALASFLFFLFGWLFPGTWVPYAFAVPTLLVTLAASLTGFFSGRALGKHGAQKARSAQIAAVRALANHHGGVITAATAADSMGISEGAADTVLTELARAEDDVTLDLDDRGRVHYLFGIGGKALEDAKWRAIEAADKQRVASPQRVAEPQRVADPQAQAIAEAEAELDAEFQADADQRQRR